MRRSRVKNYTVCPVSTPELSQKIDVVTCDRPKRYRTRSAKEFRCIWCGEPFIATRYDAKFCNPACRKKASRAIAKEGLLAQMKLNAKR